jgi:hypothetical protein
MRDIKQIGERSQQLQSEVKAMQGRFDGLH